MYKTILTVMSALCLSAPAHALTLTTSTLNGNLLDTSFSTAELLAIDLTAFNMQPIELRFTLDADDIAASGIDFNALVREVAGTGFGSLTLTLDGARFERIGPAQAATLNGELIDAFVFVPTAAQAQLSTLTLTGNPATEFYVGNPFFDEALTDWRIDFTGMQADDAFTLAINALPAVPEPREWMLMLAGIGLIGLSAARRMR